MQHDSNPPSPFHEGELAVQRRVGETHAAARNGVVLGAELPRGAARFLEGQSLVVLAHEPPATSLAFGDPGFVGAVEGGDSLRLRPAALVSPPGVEFSAGDRYGMLAIDLATRRRLRVAGTVDAVDRRTGELVLSIAEAFPNCPKYIQAREIVRGTPTERAAELAHGSSVDDRLSRRLERIDTVFIASRHPSRGLDASHRGGPPGFLAPLDERTLRTPDYAGNSMFQTLGNVEVDDRVGLTAVDFDGGVAVHVRGRARLRVDQPEDPASPTGGSGRYVDVELEAWAELALPPDLTFTPPTASPYLPA